MRSATKVLTVPASKLEILLPAVKSRVVYSIPAIISAIKYTAKNPKTFKTGTKYFLNIYTPPIFSICVQVYIDIDFCYYPNYIQKDMQIQPKDKTRNTYTDH